MAQSLDVVFERKFSPFRNDHWIAQQNTEVSSEEIYFGQVSSLVVCRLTRKTS